MTTVLRQCSSFSELAIVVLLSLDYRGWAHVMVIRDLYDLSRYVWCGSGWDGVMCGDHVY
jgi:hypothetical protein